MDRSGADQKSVRRPLCSGATSGAGWQDLTARCQRSSAHRFHIAAAPDTHDTVAADVVHLARTKDAGTNHSHLSELLSERGGIDIGRTTLRRILVNAGLSSPRRRRQPKHRVRRQRHGGRRPLLQEGGRPQLLPADPRSFAALRHSHRTQHKPPRYNRATDQDQEHPWLPLGLRRQRPA